MSQSSLFKKILVLSACLFALVVASPNFFDEKITKLPSWWPKQKINLGLDLKGGSHLLLKTDFKGYVTDQLGILRDTIRLQLRENKLGYKNFAVSENELRLRIRENIDITKISKVLAKNNDINFSNNDDVFNIVFKEEYLEKLKKNLIEQSIEIIRRRVDETGTREPSIQSQGDDMILLQVPGLEDPEHLKKLLGQTAKMTFHLVNESVDPNGHIPFDSLLVEFEDKDFIQKAAIFKKVMLNGDLLKNAYVSYDQQTRKPVVAFDFNSLGAKIFADLTKNNIGRRLAIVLDNKLVCAPTISSAILGGSGHISGNYTTQTANDLALLLRAGALPAKLEVLEERTIGPSLGEKSVNDGKYAAIIGVSLICMFMIIVYGIFGLIANLALVMNLIFLIALLSMLQSTLTLPGIAGIVLTMGMSVDANVLIFERIWEESKNGFSSIVAFDRGFKQAFNTILDSNLTTFIVAVFLYIFGTGAIKGFAVTLIFGIATSMFCAVTLTKMFGQIWLHYKRPKNFVLK